MTSKRTHPDLIIEKPDHTHVPNDSVFMFKMSPQFLEVMKFYVETSMVIDMKENDVDRPEFPNEPYNPIGLIQDFENSWQKDSDKFTSVISGLFIDTQKRSLTMSGICLHNMKDVFCQNLATSIGDLLGNKHNLDFKVLFDLDFIPLKLNVRTMAMLPDHIRNKVAKNNVPVYMAFLDTHYLGTKMGSHNDISAHKEFIDQLIIRSNLIRNLTPVDNPSYSLASEPVVIH